jgi:hypothetical protein
VAARKHANAVSHRGRAVAGAGAVGWVSQVAAQRHKLANIAQALEPSDASCCRLCSVARIRCWAEVNITLTRRHPCVYKVCMLLHAADGSCLLAHRLMVLEPKHPHAHDQTALSPSALWQ